MTNVLPYQPGLVVNGVIYRYTAVKAPDDPMVVNVQNRNATGDGYIFRSTDDWSGRPGTSIIKRVPVDNIEAKLWGMGEIDVQGKGEVKNPYVIYNYSYDTCTEPTSDPRCPNYKLKIPNFQDPSVYDPLKDENVNRVLNSRTQLESEEEIRNRRPLAEPREQRVRREVGAKAAQNALLTAQAVDQMAIFQSLNNIRGFESYSVVMSGGVYNETIKLTDKRLPDNIRALRNNRAQQALHDLMVESQYKVK